MNVTVYESKWSQDWACCDRFLAFEFMAKSSIDMIMLILATPVVKKESVAPQTMIRWLLKMNE